jgi:DtxR family Mn-dependent transcriptional regulator
LGVEKVVIVRERVEDYLGAIYRLRVTSESPVPLSALSEHFGFSPVSIHEMVQKLSQRGWIHYHPYRGVKLTEQGEVVAIALLRRHRLWERFLTDVLQIPWAEAHDIAGALEHAAPESVTERLSNLLGDPASCPHGEPIPPSANLHVDHSLSSVPVGVSWRVTRIAPESAELLRAVQEWGLLPGSRVSIIEQQDTAVMVKLDDRLVCVPQESASAIWVEVV